MGTYARQTSVNSEKSRAEIERTLIRYGASQFMYGWDRNNAIIGFVINERQLRFMLPLPDRDAQEFWRTPNNRRRRNREQAMDHWEQACRQRWRALNLVIKAKLEAVESGITTFDEEFLAHVMLPNKQTVGQFILPQVEQAYTTGKMPALLPMLPAPEEYIEEEPDAD